MKTLIFSDTHLTHKFDKKQFQYLKKIIEPVDRVIINGDFWDSYISNFDKFVTSKWKDNLFPLLKSKDTIYLPGNHDPKELLDKRVTLFCTSSPSALKVKVGKYTLVIEHGDRVAPDIDQTISWIINPITSRFASFYFAIGLKLLKKRFLYAKHFYTIHNTAKEWAKDNMKSNEIFVCGHSHISEYNINEKFINTGMIRAGYAQYLLINGEKMQFTDETY